MLHCWETGRKSDAKAASSVDTPQILEKPTVWASSDCHFTSNRYCEGFSTQRCNWCEMYPSMAAMMDWACANASSKRRFFAGLYV